MISATEKIRQVTRQRESGAWVRDGYLAKEVSEGSSEEWHLARDLIVEKQPAMWDRLIMPSLRLPMGS